MTPKTLTRERIKRIFAAQWHDGISDTGAELTDSEVDDLERLALAGLDAGEAKANCKHPIHMRTGTGSLSSDGSSSYSWMCGVCGHHEKYSSPSPGAQEDDELCPGCETPEECVCLPSPVAPASELVAEETQLEHLLREADERNIYNGLWATRLLAAATLRTQRERIASLADELTRKDEEIARLRGALRKIADDELEPLVSGGVADIEQFARAALDRKEG